MKRPVNLLVTLSAIAVLLLAPFVPTGRASADPLGTITRYSMPGGAPQPYDIVAGLDGNMWLTEYNASRVASVTMSGAITEYTLPSGYTRPKFITTGPNGSVWFTATGGVNMYAMGEITATGIIMHDLLDPPDRVEKPGVTDILFAPTSMAFGGGYFWLSYGPSRYIAQVDTSGGVTFSEVSRAYSSPTYNSRYHAGTVAYDNHEGGGVWFMGSFDIPGGGTSDWLEKIAPNGSRTIVPRSSYVSGRKPLSIDSSGTFWVAGSNPGDQLLRITRDGVMNTIAVSQTGEYPRNITFGPDRMIWATIGKTPNDGSGNRIIRVNPITHEVSRWTITTFGTTSGPRGIAIGPDMNVWFVENSAHRVSRIGIGSSPTDDVDGDGLNLSGEFTQQTTDTDIDTDDDGISDYVESVQFMGRDATFCNQVTSYCEYPNPVRKDLYVEIDWMVEPGANGLDMQPASSHVAQIEIALSDQGIRPHLDTGQLGGGNEAPYYSNVNFEPDTNNDHDFYDFKNGNGILSPQFDSANRYGIWRYQLLVPFSENNSSLGGQAYPGDDDSIIAYESLLNRAANDGTDFDLLLPRTMLHELGHNLCLTNGSSTYTGQSASCVFAGIDQAFSFDYVSAMNYNQQELVDYSHGHNGSEDHDDWSAVMSGIDDFAHQELGEGVAHSRVGGANYKKDPGRILKDPRAKKSHNNYRKPVRD